MKTSLFIHLQALKVSKSKKRPEKAVRKSGRKRERERENAHWKVAIEKGSQKDNVFFLVIGNHNQILIIKKRFTYHLLMYVTLPLKRN